VSRHPQNVLIYLQLLAAPKCSPVQQAPQRTARQGKGLSEHDVRPLRIADLEVGRSATDTRLVS
jgi:hypothetical protein